MAAQPCVCAGLCNAVLRELETTPVLGVCLGMQALAAVHGGRVTQLGHPVHGGLSEVTHSGHGLFAAIPSGAFMAFVSSASNGRWF